MASGKINEGKKYYVEIDPDEYERDGSVKQISAPIETDQVTTKVGREDFIITYLAQLLDVFDQLGGKKFKVFKYILNNMEFSNNSLIITQQELSDKSEVALKTVEETLKILKAKDIIKTRTGAIMLIPKVAIRGSYAKEKYLMHKFEVFDEKKPKKIETWEEKDARMNEKIEASRSARAN